MLASSSLSQRFLYQRDRSGYIPQHNLMREPALMKASATRRPSRARESRTE